MQRSRCIDRCRKTFGNDHGCLLALDVESVTIENKYSTKCIRGYRCRSIIFSIEIHCYKNLADCGLEIGRFGSKSDVIRDVSKSVRTGAV